MSNLRVSLYREGTVVRVGTIERNNTDGSIFRYLNEYADDSAAIPLSQSLPLSTDAYSEDQFRPYFEGLLAEGNAREALAAELHVRETDYLAILAQCGRDCIGDVIIEDDSDSNPHKRQEQLRRSKQRTAIPLFPLYSRYVKRKCRVAAFSGRRAKQDRAGAYAWQPYVAGMA